MATRAPYGPDTSDGYSAPLEPTDTLTNVATLERGASGAVSLYEDADVTSLTLGGGTNYAGLTIGKANVADKFAGGLHIGTTSGALSTGDLVVGLASAARFAFDQSQALAGVYSSGEVFNIALDGENAEIDVGWVTDAGSRLAAGGLTGNAASTTDTAGQALGVTAGAGNGTGAGGAAGLTGGQGGATGTGGAITLTSGAGGSTSGGSGNITIDAGGVTSGTEGTVYIGGTNATKLELGRSGQTTEVMGNLTVSGTTTTISTANLAVSDELIILNDGNDGNEAGVAFERGVTGDDALILWNEVNDRFELGLFDTSGGTTPPTGALSALTDLRCGDLLIGSATAATNAAVSVGVNSSSSREAWLNLIGDDTYSSYGLRIGRYGGGPNTNSEISHRGTGDLTIATGEAGAIVLKTTSTTRATIAAGGDVAIGPAAPGTTAYSKLEINGSDASADGPHQTFVTGADVYPLMQVFTWQHDNMDVSFDAYYNGAWRSSDAGSNFQIRKQSDQLLINYESGIAQGSVVTWDTALTLTAAGALTLTSPSGVDLTLGARGSSITLNESGQEALSGFTATSIVGALNESLTEAIQAQSQMGFGVFDIISTSGVDADTVYDATDFQVYDEFESTVAGGRVDAYYEARLDTRQTTISDIKIPIKGTSGSEILVDVRMDGASGSNQYTGTYGTKQTAPTSRTLVTIDGSSDLSEDQPTGEKRVIVKVEAYIDAGETLYVGRPFLKAV